MKQGFLELCNGWALGHDSLQWIVEQRIPGAKAARHKWKARAFCGTLDHAVVWAGRRRVMELPGEYGLDALPPLCAALDAIVNEVRAALAQAQSLVAIRHDQSC